MSLTELFYKGLRRPHDIPEFLHRKVSTLYHDVRSTNFYSHDWDVLLVLDACRVDTLQEVSDEYSFLPETIPEIVSVGPGSPKWMARTFTSEWNHKIANTTYITANPHTKRVLGDDTSGLHGKKGGGKDRLSQFEYLLPVWEKYWDDDLGTVPARPVTDHLVEFCRGDPTEHTIAHYMQPHFPSVPNPLGRGMDIEDEARWSPDYVWSQIREGEITVDEAYDAYRENLQYVLDEVEIVLSNIDAETVVITADHGNAFGEWGRYSHGHSYIGAIRRVPWVETSAKDTNEHTPDIEAERGTDNVDQTVEDKLRALGYR
jgi:hypothetical protein